ncbi:DNA-directed RNA polymerase subunit delta [Alkalihalobacillus pseudalcaliphilus]|uniref:DNA-directed RNA polymerase subunit delta n=1 Tax=Alkalihalobacillus pseudalcaliphilus TaxID=79884 RepID=UPI00064DCD0C|nr:DNA-directed RNA polymerase subunit delta [Alkalihalobacillus pseudalcaliphilus]KMK78229.1 DNA-directed RNA polymerase subunit delta [Alkalihalobacillus pseudalcaliphilus]
MRIADIKKEDLAEYSMVELAYLLMQEKKEPFNYHILMAEIASLKEMSDEEVKERISFLYTDLNIDGRFLTLGDNLWGLRAWYPLEQVEEEITSSVSKPKKKAKVAEDDEFLDEEYEEDEFEDLEDELDEISQDEDEDEDDKEEEDIYSEDDQDMEDDFDDVDDEDDSDEDSDK